MGNNLREAMGNTHSRSATESTLDEPFKIKRSHQKEWYTLPRFKKRLLKGRIDD